MGARDRPGGGREHTRGGSIVTGAVVAIRPRTLGDLVLLTPALRALHRGHPGRPLEVVTEARYASLFEGLPHVTRVWPMERSIAATIRLIGALRRQEIEWAVDFFGNPRTALVTSACGARHTAGYALRGRERAYAVRVPRELRWAEPGEVRREYAGATHLRLALAAGGAADGLETRVSVSAPAALRAAALLGTAGISTAQRAIGMVPTGTWATKTWPLGSAAQLARRLLGADREVLLLAGPGEAEWCGRLAALAPGVRTLPPCGVPELTAVISELGAVVGTDSGPIHLAASLGLPTYSWFGPTHPDTWSPPGARHGYWRTALPCRGCDRVVCAHWNCLPMLTADEAAERISEHLERHARVSSNLHTAAGA